MMYGLSNLLNSHPGLWAAVGTLAVRSKYDWKIISGFRSSSEQDALYAIGRTAATERKTVTDAKGGQSAHNYGLALDIVPTLDKGATTVSDTNHPAFAEKDKLLADLPWIQPVISTSSGRDYAHVEMRNWQAQKNWKEVMAVASVLSLIAVMLVR